MDFKDTVNAIKNVELPMLYAGVSSSERRKRASELMELVEMSEEAIAEFQAKVAELDPLAEDYEEQLLNLKKELAENLEAIYEEYAPAELKAIQDAIGNAIEP